MSQRVQTPARLPVQLRHLIDRAVPALRLRNRQQFIEQALERELLHSSLLIPDVSLRADIHTYVTRTGTVSGNGGADDSELA
jgi:hypothetical protein